MTIGDTQIESTLIQSALEVRQNAHSPYSNYQVGAALLTNEGEIVCGCNVENAAYGSTICAERAAVFTPDCDLSSHAG